MDFQSQTPHFGVIGSPIKQSLSPVLFEYLSFYFNQPLNYQSYEITQEHLNEFLKNKIFNLNLSGINVTIPHKEKVIPHCQNISSAANICQAVNVVKIDQMTKTLSGYNTDIHGIKETFKQLHFDPSQKSIVVLGAGGAAQAVCFALAEAKAKIFLSLIDHLEIK